MSAMGRKQTFAAYVSNGRKANIRFPATDGREKAMSEQFTRSARLLGIVSATIIVLLGLAYGVTLALGFLSLESPAQPIGNPFFAILEALILALAPAMVALMVAVHAWAPAQAKTLSLTAVCFMVMVASVTCSVHFVILTLSRQPSFLNQPSLDLFFAFKWPSVVYALDILAWDLFFALSMLFAAAVFRGAGLNAAIRVGMITSAAFALAGLGGVVLGDMRVRNIGIAGYLGAFLVVDALLVFLFLRTKPLPALGDKAIVSSERLAS